MADKTVTVRPSGGTYTTLAAAITGEVTANSNLTASGMNGILTISIEGDWSGGADTTSVLIDPGVWTVDSTHYINIVVAEASRHKGTVSSSYYRLEAVSSGRSTLNCNTNYTHLTGLQIRDTTGAQYSGLGLNGCAGCIVDSCIIYDCGWIGVEIRLAANNNIIANTIVVDSAQQGISSVLSSSGTNRLYNCNVSDSSLQGILSGDNSTLVCTNCYSGGNTGDDLDVSGTGAMTLTTCYTEDGTESTSTAAYSTSTFTSVTSGSENFSLVSGSGLINVGTDLSSDATYPFDWDITGATRTGTWDVGAVEYVAEGGLSIPVAMHHYRQMRG